MDDYKNDANSLIEEFEKELGNEPSLSQISIATTAQSSSLAPHSDNSLDSSAPFDSGMENDSEGEKEEQSGLDGRKSDSALSKSTFPGMKIDERHSNYILMYDMLTGIRISVSRCQAKPSRELEFSDYTSNLHLAFDSSGNEFTPSSKYDFKFKDYAPWIFRSLREAFRIDAADYLVLFSILIIDVLDRKVCFIRIGVSWEKWKLFLLFPRFQVHYKNY
jgi:hypothetical protein